MQQQQTLFAVKPPNHKTNMAKEKSTKNVHTVDRSKLKELLAALGFKASKKTDKEVLEIVNTLPDNLDAATVKALDKDVRPFAKELLDAAKAKKTFSLSDAADNEDSDEESDEEADTEESDEEADTEESDEDEDEESDEDSDEESDEDEDEESDEDEDEESDTEEEAPAKKEAKKDKPKKPVSKEASERGKALAAHRDAPKDEWGNRIGSQAANINKAILEATKPITVAEVAEITKLPNGRVNGHFIYLKKKDVITITKIDGGKSVAFPKGKEVKASGKPSKKK